MNKVVVKSCNDCPMCYMNDMSSGYGCSLVKYPDNQIKENKQFMAETPDWCPLKKEDTLLTFNKE